MSDKSEKLHPIRMDTRSFSFEEALATMRNVSDGTHIVHPLPTDPPAIGLAGSVWILESMHAAADFAINCRLTRQPTPGPTATVRYRIMRAGRLNGVLGEQSITLEPGDLFISRYNTPYVLDLEDFSGYTISMSGASLGQERADRVRPTVLRAHEPENRVITGAVEGFVEALEDVDVATANRLAIMLRGTLERHLDSLAADAPASPERTRDWSGPMLQFIDENLSDQALGVEALMEAFPTSRAVIYRTFEEHGGVKRHISKRRLERALSVLVFDRPDISIGQIATDHGYRDQAHFSRAFKKHFGITPKDARASFRNTDTLDDGEDALAGGSGLLMRELLDRSGHF